MFSQPRRFNAQTSALPMKPAPPVTRIRELGKVVWFHAENKIKTAIEFDLPKPALRFERRQGIEHQVFDAREFVQDNQTRKPDSGCHAQSGHFPVCKRNICRRTGTYEVIAATTASPASTQRIRTGRILDARAAREQNLGQPDFTGPRHCRKALRLRERNCLRKRYGRAKAVHPRRWSIHEASSAKSSGGSCSAARSISSTLLMNKL